MYLALGVVLLQVYILLAIHITNRYGCSCTPSRVVAVKVKDVTAHISALLTVLVIPTLRGTGTGVTVALLFLVLVRFLLR
jgi:hypothetical protein